jgi:transposase
VHYLDERIAQYDRHIHAMARQCAVAQRLMQLMGVGEVSATAMVAMVGNAREFDGGRQFAAWLGLVPGQYSSGGKARLGSITKAGDFYLRGLLVNGARAVLEAAAGKSDSLSRWAVQLAERRHPHPSPRPSRQREGASALKSSGLQAAKCASRKPSARLCAAPSLSSQGPQSLSTAISDRL